MVPRSTATRPVPLMITLIQSLLLDQTKPGAHSRDALQAEEKEAVVTMDVNEAQAVVAFSLRDR